MGGMLSWGKRRRSSATAAPPAPPSKSVADEEDRRRLVEAAGRTRLAEAPVPVGGKPPGPRSGRRGRRDAPPAFGGGGEKAGGKDGARSPRRNRAGTGASPGPGAAGKARAATGLPQIVRHLVARTAENDGGTAGQPAGAAGAGCPGGARPGVLRACGGSHGKPWESRDRKTGHRRGLRPRPADRGGVLRGRRPVRLHLRHPPRARRRSERERERRRGRSGRGPSHRRVRRPLRAEHEPRGDLRLADQSPDRDRAGRAEADRRRGRRHRQ